MENKKAFETNSSSKKYRCEQGRLKYVCVEYGGSQICLHGKIKYRCKICKGSQICSHGRRKSSCKDCGNGDYCEQHKQKIFCVVCGGSQICSHNRQNSFYKKCLIKITIENRLRSSRQSDSKYNRYDADRFIDKCFLKTFIENFPICYYEDCKTTLQYSFNPNDLATIERLDNSIGHIKSNCVLCCLSCGNK